MQTKEFHLKDLLILVGEVKEIGTTNELEQFFINEISIIADFIIQYSPYGLLNFYREYLYYFLYPLSNYIGYKLHCNVNEYEKEINLTMENLIEVPKWSVGSFVTLALGFHFLGDLKRKRYDCKYYTDLCGNALYERQPMISDISKIIEQINTVHELMCSTYSNEIKNRKIKLPCLPITFLEISEQLNLYIDKPAPQPSYEFLGSRSIMADLIRCKQHNLNGITAKHGWPAEENITYNAAQLIAIYRDKINANASVDDVIRFCIKNSFYPYLPSESKLYRVKSSAYKYFPTIAEIENSISNAQIDYSYKYHYEKLVRLKKYILKKFLHGGVVEVFHPNKREAMMNEGVLPDYDLPFIELEPSYAQFILNEQKVIEIRQKITSFQRCFENLIFIKNEIDPCVEEITKNSSSLHCAEVVQAFQSGSNDIVPDEQKEEEPDKQLLIRSAIKRYYVKLTGIAWEKIFEREKANGLVVAKIPNTKPYRYEQTKVEKWLIEHGYYTKPELLALLNGL